MTRRRLSLLLDLAVIVGFFAVVLLIAHAAACGGDVQFKCLWSQ